MPSRLIRDGWLESEAINQLKPEEERFFLRLCLRADDFGRYHGHHTLLKSNLFPMMENVRSTDIPRWIAACEKSGLVRCYEADAKPFLLILKFGQRIKENAVSKFPEPPPFSGQIPDPPGQSGQIPEVPGKSGTIPPYSESDAEAKPDSKPKAGAAARVVVPILLNTEPFLAAWADWIQHRREIKKPVTPTSEKAQLKELESMGVDRAIAAIRFTIAKGWQGLKEPFPANGHPRPTDLDVEKLNRTRV